MRSGKDEDITKILLVVDFVRKKHFGKVRGHCHLTGKYRRPAHNKCNINVTQIQKSFIPFFCRKFVIYDCHLFFRKLVDKKNEKVKFDVIPQTNEEYISVTCDCIRFVDSYRFLSSSLDSSVKKFGDKHHKTLEKLKKEIVGYNVILTIINGLESLVIRVITSEDLKKDFPDEIETLRKVLKI